MITGTDATPEGLDHKGAGQGDQSKYDSCEEHQKTGNPPYHLYSSGHNDSYAGCFFSLHHFPSFQGFLKRLNLNVEPSVGIFLLLLGGVVTPQSFSSKAQQEVSGSLTTGWHQVSTLKPAFFCSAVL